MAREGSRANDEMRPVRITPGFIKYPEGSAFVQLGDTWVICTASVEESVPPFLRGQARGWITAEYSMLPRSTLQRTPREVARGRPDGRTLEIQRLIGRSLRTAVDLRALGERMVIVDCDVIQADGGTRTASITGGYVALALAIRKLRDRGVLTVDPLRAAVAATSVGLVDGEPRLDLSYEEDSRAEVDFNVVMNDRGEFVEIQGTAEGQPFSRDQSIALLDLAARGIRQLFTVQQAALGH